MVKWVYLAYIAPLISAIMPDNIAFGISDICEEASQLCVAPGSMLDILQGRLIAMERSMESLSIFVDCLTERDLSVPNATIATMPSDKHPSNQTDKEALSFLLKFIFPCNDKWLNTTDHKNIGFADILDRIPASQRMEKLADLLVEPQTAATLEEQAPNDRLYCYKYLTRLLKNKTDPAYFQSKDAYILTREAIISTFLYKYLKSLAEYKELLRHVYAKASSKGKVSTFFAMNYLIHPREQELLNAIADARPFYPTSMASLPCSLYKDMLLDLDVATLTFISDLDMQKEFDIPSSILSYALLRLMNCIVYDRSTDSYASADAIPGAPAAIHDFYQRFICTSTITRAAWITWRNLQEALGGWKEDEFRRDCKLHGRSAAFFIHFTKMLYASIGLESADVMAWTLPAAQSLLVRALGSVLPTLNATMHKIPDDEDADSYHSIKVRLNGSDPDSSQGIALSFYCESIHVWTFSPSSIRAVQLSSSGQLPVSLTNSYIEWLIKRIYRKQAIQDISTDTSLVSPLSFIASGIILSARLEDQPVVITLLTEKLAAEEELFISIYHNIFVHLIEYGMFVSRPILRHAIATHDNRVRLFRWIPAQCAYLWKIMVDVSENKEFKENMRSIYSQGIENWKGPIALANRQLLEIQKSGEDSSTSQQADEIHALLWVRCFWVYVQFKQYQKALRCLDKLDLKLLLKAATGSNHRSALYVWLELGLQASDIQTLHITAHNMRENSLGEEKSFTTHQQKALLLLSLAMQPKNTDAIQSLLPLLYDDVLSYILPMLLLRSSILPNDDLLYKHLGLVSHILKHVFTKVGHVYMTALFKQDIQKCLTLALHPANRLFPHREEVENILHNVCGVTDATPHQLGRATEGYWDSLERSHEASVKKAVEALIRVL